MAGLSMARAEPHEVIVDTDIGDDIDDAFALALAIESPELRVLGITTAWGDTGRRARLVDRFLRETGKDEIPVAVGIPTKTDTKFTQGDWADASVPRAHPDAVDFLLDQIRRHPHQITLIALAPQTNLAAAFDCDPATFRQLKRIVAMGGSIRLGYGALGFGNASGPDAEYNIKSDIAAARRVLASGVPVTLMPLDSTEIQLADDRRGRLPDNPATRALAQLQAEWRRTNPWNQPVPVLFDVVPVMSLIDPKLCPVVPMAIAIDEAGFTRAGPGAPNAAVCLNSNPGEILERLTARLSAPAN